MIEFACSRCETLISAEDQNAGQAVVCPNCSATINVPGPPAPAASTAVAATPGQPGPTQIVVNVAGVAPQTEVVHKQVSMFVAWLLLVFLNGAQYMYMGQIGKGVVVLFLDLGLATFAIITCGIGLAIYLPWRTLCLVDTLVVASRSKKGPIHPWRCF